MQSVSVHIAVLAVGKDAAPTQTVSELAASAGHEIVGRATVTDTQAAIRAQLQRWIDDPNVDVIIVSGGIESENTAAALKPLVTQALPGFTDLFRYLAFQEIGASAMLSNAEAAQCSSTFVFVLPASAGAVRAAMEQLILPQLDPSTTPKNLLSSMPRLKRLGGDAIPMPIAKEKTASGSGLTPKAPSGAVRARSHSGGNVIRRPDLFDPPTKPIDVAKLEAQIALSESAHTETKQVDLSRLPRVPPGAESDDTDQITPGDITRTDSLRVGEDSTSGQSARVRRKSQRTEPAAVVPPPRPGKSLLPEPPAPRGPVPLPESGHTPVAPLPSVPGVAHGKPPTEPPPARPRQTTGPQIAVPSVIPRSPSGPMRKPPTQPPPAGARRPPTQPSPAVGSAPAKRPTNPPPPPAPRPPTSPPPVSAARPPTNPPPVSAARPPTNPPPVSAARPPTSPPPVSAARPPTSPPPVSAARPPTNPPPSDRDLAALVEAPLRRSGDLPAGTFHYPTKQNGGASKLLFVLLGMLLLGVGFAAFVLLFPQDKARNTTPAKPIETLATAPVDAAIIADVDAGVSAPANGTTSEPLDAAVAAPPRPTPSPRGTQVTRPTPNTGTRPPRGSPVATSVAAPAGSGQEPASDTVETAPDNPPPTTSDCDEVACVLSKYDRPCCERYRPKDSAIAPRTADGLPAELDKAMVRAGVQKVKPRVVACGEKASQKGMVKVAVSVRPDGSVSSASIVESPDPALGDCVAAAMKKAEFGKSVAGGSFTYPFAF